MVTGKGAEFWDREERVKTERRQQENDDVIIGNDDDIIGNDDVMMTSSLPMIPLSDWLIRTDRQTDYI